ncbi:MAG: hypothetical protein AB8G77_18340 [Rhodothermales bacterium]
MSTNEYVDFRKVRDFGDVINVTFAFLRQNFIPLGKCLLYIVGPVALLGGISSIGYWDQLSLTATEGESLSSDFQAGLFGISYLMFLLLSMLSTVLAITIVNAYMQRYQEKGGGSIELDEVWEHTKKQIGMMIGTSIFSFVLYFGSFLIILLPMSIALFNTSTAASIVAGILVFFAFIIWFIALFYSIAVISMLFPIRFHEKLGLIDTFNRSRYLIQQNFGNTFAVLMVSGILMMILGLFFNAPNYMLAFMGGLHAFGESDGSMFRYILIALSILGTLGSSLLYALPATAATMQYFSLVEKKEKTGLMGRIDELNEGHNDLF